LEYSLSAQTNGVKDVPMIALYININWFSQHCFICPSGV